jgi:hypothetical protein
MSVSAKIIQAGTELQEGAQKEFRPHFFEILFFQSAFDSGKARGEFLELFFEARDVSFLELLYLERFQDVDRTAGFTVGFPIKEGGFGDTEFR